MTDAKLQRNPCVYFYLGIGQIIDFGHVLSGDAKKNSTS